MPKLRSYLTDDMGKRRIAGDDHDGYGLPTDRLPAIASVESTYVSQPGHVLSAKDDELQTAVVMLDEALTATRDIVGVGSTQTTRQQGVADDLVPLQVELRADRFSPTKQAWLLSSGHLRASRGGDAEQQDLRTLRPSTRADTQPRSMSLAALAIAPTAQLRWTLHHALLGLTRTGMLMLRRKS